MQIVCPNCTTSYQIADTAVGANGRSVRCVRCQSVWHVAPLVPEPQLEMAEAAASDEPVAAFRDALVGEAAAPAASPPEPPSAEPSLDELAGSHVPESTPDTAAAQPVETAPVALAEIPIPVEQAPPLVPAAGADGASPGPVVSLDDNGPPDIESVAARRSRNAARQRRGRFRLALPAAIVALATLSVVLVGWRKDIVRHAPQLASFYSAIGLPVNLRGLTFTDLKIGNEIHDGVPVLVVEGMIVSTVSKPVDVPRLRFALRNASEAEVYAWTAQPSQPVLGAFEAMPFRSRLASPPAEGHDIQVRFFTSRDAVAGLR